MTNPTPEQRETLFPATCHIKIIGENHPDMEANIHDTLRNLNINDPVQAGNESSQRRYITYNMSLLVETAERMDEIDQALCSIPGVKMIL